MAFPSYAYNASAIALGGEIRQGNRTTIIPSIASVCLASAGGEASNSFDYYDRDGISFTHAATRVGGQANGVGSGRTYTTVSEVSLINLRIFERISIARMNALVTSTRVVTSEDPLTELQPDRTTFSILVSYHGVVVDDQEVEIQVDTPLCQAGSYSKFATMLMARQENLVPATVQVLTNTTGDPAMPPMTGPLVTLPNNALAVANRLPVAGFGRASFGDVVVKPDRQRVSLLRFSLNSGWTTKKPAGSADGGGGELSVLEEGEGGGGSASAGDGGTNGIPVWP